MNSEFVLIKTSIKYTTEKNSIMLMNLFLDGRFTHSVRIILDNDRKIILAFSDKDDALTFSDQKLEKRFIELSGANANKKKSELDELTEILKKSRSATTSPTPYDIEDLRDYIYKKDIFSDKF